MNESLTREQREEVPIQIDIEKSFTHLTSGKWADLRHSNTTVEINLGDSKWKYSMKQLLIKEPSGEKAFYRK